MRLNGWQRLFVVMGIIWSLYVVGGAIVRWPTTSSLSRVEVYRRLHPEVGRRIADYDQVLGFQISPPRLIISTDFNGERRVTGLDGRGHVFPAQMTDAKIEEAIARHGIAAVTYPAQPTTAIDVVGFNVSVFSARGAAETEALRSVAIAVDEARTEALRSRRIIYSSVVLALIAIPLVGLYLCGFLMAWVRKGFAASGLET